MPSFQPSSPCSQKVSRRLLDLFVTPSRDVWSAQPIRTELGETKLLDLSITDYFNKMTSLTDTLASIG